MTPPTTSQPGAESATTRPRAPLGPRVLGAVMLARGAFLSWYAYDAADGDFAPAGPWLAPVVVSGSWLVLAVCYLVRQFLAPPLPTRAVPPAPAGEPGT